MRILLINPPYRAVSQVALGAQVPLGLLAIGGPLIDAGHTVLLLDADEQRLSRGEIVARIAAWRPEVVMTGHAGSTPAHPTILHMLAAIRQTFPRLPTVYGGVYPSYRAQEILAAYPQVDVVVRGEGERIAVQLAAVLAAGGPLAEVPGIAFRRDGRVVLTPQPPPIANLDACRVGWELIEDWDRYQCWGVGRSAIIQFSRGCPHRCTYCGQRDFWVRWRHRNPVRLADEIEMLHRRHGIRFFDFADENPTSSRKAWRRLIEELAARALPIRLFATIRAADIVRDDEFLHLYRLAGFACILMGIDTTDPATIDHIRKGSSAADDLTAIRLLRRHGILSMAAHIAGLQTESVSTRLRALRQLLAYDPDLLNAMYATPHAWTPFAAEAAAQPVIEPDQARWDYRHQVLGTPNLPAWLLFLLVKLTELCVQTRPRQLWRLLAHPDRDCRRALRWCVRNSAKVWLLEFAERYSRAAPRAPGSTPVG